MNLLTAPIARLFAMVLVPDMRRPARIDLFIVAAIVRDWRARGRPHRAYVIGLLCMLIVQLVRRAFAQAEVWRSMAHSIAALAA